MNKAQIDAFCIEEEDMIEMREAQTEEEYKLNMAKNAVRAFDDRKSALENEVKLWGANYFSTPIEEEKTEDTSIKIKGKDESSTKVRKKMNAKRG